jgi:nucleotide-binding universal stress UspA family protein
LNSPGLSLTHTAEVVDFRSLRVVDPADGATGWGPASADDWLSSARKQAATVLEGAEERAAGAGADVATDSTTGRPSQGIVVYADEGGFDHVVVGSHGREGPSRVPLGSAAGTVSVPVTVACRPD